MTTAVVALLAELGASTPRLPRAACRGRTELFDREDAEGIAAAKNICWFCCPELASCEAWAATMNPNRLTGVIAGAAIQSQP
jgi:Transcription factor WhiB